MDLFFIQITIQSKGSDLNDNKYASLNVFWGELERQIRIQGIISKLDELFLISISILDQELVKLEHGLLTKVKKSKIDQS